MAQHRKPTRHRTRTMLVVTAPIVGLPLTTGVAHAVDWSDVRGPLAKCESGGNATIKNRHSSASGLYQITTPTWVAHGGLAYSRTAGQATPAEQEIVAKRIFARSGLGPWNSSKRCWRGLIGKLKAKLPVPRVLPTERVYRVQAGDTLSEIAARTGHRWEDLWAENKATIADPARISVGLSINLL